MGSPRKGGLCVADGWVWRSVRSCAILIRMAQYPLPLDEAFRALADPTRRAVLSRLGTGPASISELARPFDMALPSFMKHIRLLEKSGWVRTRKVGRVRTCTIDESSFAAVEGWLAAQRDIWERRTDRLERFVTDDPTATAAVTDNPTKS